MFKTTASFQALFSLALVGDEAVGARPQKSLEACLGGIVISKVVLLKSIDEEPLRQIFGVFVIDIPFYANVVVERLPIAFEDGVKRSLTNLRLTTAYSDNGGAICFGKVPKWTTDICVRVAAAISYSYHCSMQGGGRCSVQYLKRQFATNVQHIATRSHNNRLNSTRTS